MDEEFEPGGCGCFAMLLLIVLVVTACVWRYHHDLSTKQHPRQLQFYQLKPSPSAR